MRGQRVRNEEPVSIPGAPSLSSTGFSYSLSSQNPSHPAQAGPVVPVTAEEQLLPTVASLMTSTTPSQEKLTRQFFIELNRHAKSHNLGSWKMLGYYETSL